MKCNKFIFVILFLIFLVFSCISFTSAANTYTVNSSNYTTIISSAGAGDTIEFESGDYSHSTTLIISKSLNLIAKDEVKMRTSSTNANVLTINSNYVNISGFTLFGSSDGAAILLGNNAKNVNIRNNTIINNWDGINCESSSVKNIIIENNQINNNRNYGIRFNNGGDEIYIRNNKFISNSGRGMGLISIKNSKIINNTCFNQFDAGIQVDKSNNVLIHGNVINNTTRNSGIVVSDGNYIEISGNNVSNTSGSASGQTTQSCFGIHTQNANNIVIKDNIIRNSNSKGTGWRGGILTYNTVTSYNATFSNNKLLDMELVNDINGTGIYSNSVNSIFENNEISNIYNGIYTVTAATNSTFSNNIINNTHYGLRISSPNALVKNNKISNSIYGFYCNGVNLIAIDNTFNLNYYGIWHVTNYGKIINNMIMNSSYEGLVITGSYNNLTNNTIIFNNKGIRLSGNYNSVIGSNIHNNTIFGINITGNGNKINYNRILSNGMDLSNGNSLDANNVDYNWWGSNDITNIKNIINVNSYFVVNATALKNEGVVGDNWLITYTFYLNGTIDSQGSDDLPEFISFIIDSSNNTIYSQSAKISKVIPIQINNVAINSYFVVVDNEIIPLGYFSSEKGATAIEMKINGENSIGKTVIIEAKLKDSFGNNLINKLLYLIVNGETIASAQTNNLGEVAFNYTFLNSGKFVFIVSFQGDENYNSSLNSQELSISGNTLINLFKDKNEYFVGEYIVLTWIAENIYNINPQGIIYFYEDGKLWHQIPVYLKDGKLVYQFKMAHKTLDIILTFNGDNHDNSSQDKVTTIVKNRPMISISNLTVAKRGYINVSAYDKNGKPINSGKVTLQFDNYEIFTTNIVNGVAKFSKLFYKAGNSRLLKIKCFNINDKLIYSRNIRININKGIAKLNLTIKPTTNTITNKIKLITNISSVTLNSKKTPWYHTIIFYNNNEFQHKIIVPLKISNKTAYSVIDYVFKKSHNNMTIYSVFNGEKNYYTTKDSVKIAVIKK